MQFNFLIMQMGLAQRTTIVEPLHQTTKKWVSYVHHFIIYEIWFHGTEIEFLFDEKIFPTDETNLKNKTNCSRILILSQLLLPSVPNLPHRPSPSPHTIDS